MSDKSIANAVDPTATHFKYIVPAGEGCTEKKFCVVFTTSKTSPKTIASIVNQHAIDAINEARQSEYEDFDVDDVRDDQPGYIQLDGEHAQLDDMCSRVASGELQRLNIRVVVGSGGATSDTQQADVSAAHRNIKSYNKTWDRESSKIRQLKATLIVKGDCEDLLKQIPRDPDLHYKKAASVISLKRQLKADGVKPNKLDTICLMLFRFQTILPKAETEKVVNGGWDKVGLGLSVSFEMAMASCGQYQMLTQGERAELKALLPRIFEIVKQFGRIPYKWLRKEWSNMPETLYSKDRDTLKLLSHQNSVRLDHTYREKEQQERQEKEEEENEKKKKRKEEKAAKKQKKKDLVSKEKTEKMKLKAAADKEEEKLGKAYVEGCIEAGSFENFKGKKNKKQNVRGLNYLKIKILDKAAANIKEQFKQEIESRVSAEVDNEEDEEGDTSMKETGEENEKEEDGGENEVDSTESDLSSSSEESESSSSSEDEEEDAIDFKNGKEMLARYVGIAWWRNVPDEWKCRRALYSVLLYLDGESPGFTTDINELELRVAKRVQEAKFKAKNMFTSASNDSDGAGVGVGASFGIMQHSDTSLSGTSCSGSGNGNGSGNGSGTGSGSGVTTVISSSSRSSSNTGSGSGMTQNVGEEKDGKQDDRTKRKRGELPSLSEFLPTTIAEQMLLGILKRKSGSVFDSSCPLFFTTEAFHFYILTNIV